MSSKNKKQIKIPTNQLLHSPLLTLNRKQLTFIFRYLTVDDISRVASTCRRLNNAVQYYMQSLQVFVDWSEEEEMVMHDSNSHQKCPGFSQVTLRYCSPADFFFPNFPFHNLKKLFLAFDDQQNELINLTALVHLKYLKIRGQNIVLSSNRLPSVTHINIDDPNSSEKQVFPHLSYFKLKFNVQDFSIFNNTTESEAVKYAFLKSLDILLDKPRLEHVSFEVIIPEMNLLLFEMFVDQLTTFLKGYTREIDKGSIQILFQYGSDYKKEDKDLTRWEKVWYYLTEDLTYDFNNVTLKVESFQTEYIPVY